MRISLTAAVVAVGLCLMGAGIAKADVTSRWQLSLLRGSTTLETVYGTTEAEAWAKCTQRIADLSETANVNTVFACQTPRYYGTAVATCQLAQPQQTRQVACSTGTGTWTQTSTSTVSAPPGCNVTTTWSPTSPPAGACQVSGTASLSWTPPTKNTDGTALTNLAGYRISYGLTPDALTQTIQIANAGVSSYVISNLAPGSYYFGVRAYTADGTESLLSSVVSKTVQ